MPHDPDTFADQLRRDGYLEVVTLTLAPGHAIPEHVHAWDVRALVLSGEMRLRCGNTERLCRPGDVFELAAGEPHAEWYGPDGYAMLVGRRHHPAPAAAG